MKRILNRVIAIMPAIVLQIAIWVALYGWFKNLIPLITLVLSFFSFVFVLYIITKRNEANYKILWLLIIFSFPVMGAWLYLFFGNKKTAAPIIKKINAGKKEIKYKFKSNSEVLEEIKNDNYRLYQTLNHISNKTNFPMYYNETAKYYKIGEEMFEDMKNELEQAKEFIFIEYFILENGEFWDSIVKILEKKVKQGVDVRVLYDDLGSISTYSLKSMVKLNVKGIKCTPFNPLIFIKSTLNNRDHRKMMIIDNKVAFSGGVNIADEYINKKTRFGHWKDIGFKITGEPVNTYTYMFMEFWNAYSQDKITDDCFKTDRKNLVNKDGYILSYYDSPANNEEISFNLYIDLLYQAKEYVWFYSPYLILGDSLTDALVKAAKRGVNVKIIVPGIPDKKIVYRIAKSYYPELLEAGVEIYEYTPGFLHAKACIFDDQLCTIGTVNLDYRSLFLHFECNSIFYKSSIIKSLKEDFNETLNKSNKISKNNVKNNFLHRIVDGILRIFAPLC